MASVFVSKQRHTVDFPSVESAASGSKVTYQPESGMKMEKAGGDFSDGLRDHPIDSE